jgi:hypothetical protein
METEAMTAGVRDVLAERQRQIDVEGWTAEHDAQHSPDDLYHAALCYIIAGGPDSKCPAGWPWDLEWWKPKDRRRNLVRAGALFLAATDRAKAASLQHVAIEMAGRSQQCMRMIDKFDFDATAQKLKEISDRMNRSR